MLVDTVNELRDQLLRAKGIQTLGELAEQIGVTTKTLARFLRGGAVGLATLEAIEAWLATQKAPYE